jgi:hypothetical protein
MFLDSAEAMIVVRSIVGALIREVEDCLNSGENFS